VLVDTVNITFGNDNSSYSFNATVIAQNLPSNSGFVSYSHNLYFVNQKKIIFFFQFPYTFPNSTPVYDDSYFLQVNWQDPSSNPYWMAYCNLTGSCSLSTRNPGGDFAITYCPPCGDYPPSNDSGISSGAVAAIVIVVIVLVIAGIIGGYCYYRKRMGMYQFLYSLG